MKAFIFPISSSFVSTIIPAWMKYLPSGFDRSFKEALCIE